MQPEDEQFLKDLSEALSRRRNCQIFVVGKMLEILLEHYTIAEISETFACILESSARGMGPEAEEAWSSVITYLREGKPLLKHVEEEMPLKIIRYYHGSD